MSKLSHSDQPTMDALDLERIRREMPNLVTWGSVTVGKPETFGWRASLRDQWVIGYGATEAEAVADLLQKIGGP